MIAEVIVNRTAKKLNRTFDYHVPQELEGLILVGSKVLIPFGSGKAEREQEGFVVGLKEKTNFENELKDIIKLEEQLKDEQIELAKWMAKRYFTNVSECIKLMLTPGTRNKIKEKRIQDKKIRCVYLAKTIEEIEFEIETGKIKSEKHKKLLYFVKDNEGVTIPELEMFTDCSRSTIQTLCKNGYLEIIEEKIERNPLNYKDIEKIKKTEKTEKLELTEEQNIAYQKVEKCLEENINKTFLLYGITGSRKNRNLFTTYTKILRKRKNSHFISTRNIINSTNVR